MPDHARGTQQLVNTFEASHLFTADDTSEVQQKGRFGLRKPLFYPLNYGNDDLERINGLNGDGQDTRAARSDFLKTTFALDSRESS
jgi:hypothetical protein